MFDFKATGDIEALITQQEGRGHIIRLRCPTSFKFPKPGETPAHLAVQVENPALVKGLSIGQTITVSGVGAVGAVDWEKPTKFGQKPQTKEIQNFHFKASKIDAQAAK